MTDIDTRNAYVLARLADCATPDTLDSPGAQWLVLVAGAADEVREAIASGADRDDAIHETADSLVPIYTHQMWAVYVDLAAYTEDIDDFGPIEDMTSAASIALYEIARRLLDALTIDEDEEE